VVYFRETLCAIERRLADELRREEARSLLQNAAWLERERIAQEEFRRRKKLEDERQKEKEEREVFGYGGGRGRSKGSGRGVGSGGIDAVRLFYL
jgi:hypothetical protein